MEKYDDYPDNLPASQYPFTKYVIIVPSDKDKKSLMDAFEHIHYSDIDTGYIPVNQLAHDYLQDNNIIVDAEAYEKLHVKR